MPGKARIDLNKLRDLVCRRIAETSVRDVADDIGISRGGVESFLQGREPYSRMRRLIVAWHLRQGNANQRVTRSHVDEALIILQAFVDASTSTAQRAKRLAELKARLG